MEILGDYTRAELVQSLLWLNGKPFSLRDYPFFIDIYDLNAPKVLLKTGRQVAKSSFCANEIALDSLTPHFKTLYITPTQTQTSRFSNTRLTKVLRHSPVIRKHYIGTDLTNNVFTIILKDGAEINLSYALDDADRIRGISSDQNRLDEVQDIEMDAVLPVVNECLSATKYRPSRTSYSGTPKSMENTIEHLWQQSSQAEWIMKCGGCGQHQYIASSKSIGKHGPICVKCGHPLNPREGFWYEFNPNPKSGTRGFHISQPMLPLNSEEPERWADLLHKYETYSTPKFNNEVMGISDAIGGRMVSLGELQALCRDYTIQVPPDNDILKGVSLTAGGVDWTGGGSEFISRTVVWVFGWTTNFKMKTIYFEIMRGENPAADVRTVADILQACKCQMVVGDAGGGAHANASLKEMLGPHRVMQVQYGSFKANLCKWNKKDRLLLDRTAAVDSVMMQLKHQAIIFPNLQLMTVPIQDILNEHEETIQQDSKSGGTRVWRHAPTAPDDCLHAMVYAWLALKLATNQLRLYDLPTDEEP